MERTEKVRLLRKVLPYALSWYEELSDAQLDALHRKHQGRITAVLVAEACARDDALLASRLSRRQVHYT